MLTALASLEWRGLAKQIWQHVSACVRVSRNDTGRHGAGSGRSGVSDGPGARQRSVCIGSLAGRRESLRSDAAAGYRVVEHNRAISVCSPARVPATADERTTTRPHRAIVQVAAVAAAGRRTNPGDVKGPA